MSSILQKSVVGVQPEGTAVRVKIVEPDDGVHGVHEAMALLTWEAARQYGKAIIDASVLAERAARFGVK